MIKALALFSALSLASAGYAMAGETASVPASSDEAAVRKFVMEEIERWNTNGPLNPDRYTPDSDYVDVNGNRIKGFAARKGKHTQPRLVDSRITLLDLTVRFITPDVAVAHQTQNMSGKRGPDGEILPTEKQLSTRILVKQGGRWVQTAFQNTIVRPVPPYPGKITRPALPGG